MLFISIEESLFRDIEEANLGNRLVAFPNWFTFPPRLIAYPPGLFHSRIDVL